MEQVFFNVSLSKLEPILERWVKEAQAEIQLEQIELKEKPEKLLTVQQAAKLLNLTVPTIYSKVSKSELPVMKRGKRLYFSSTELIQYIKEGRKKSNAEIEVQAEAYALIVCNVFALILQSYEPIFLKFHTFFSWFEVFSVLIFTLEYVDRVWAINLKGAKRSNLIVSTFGIIFLLAIQPFYLPMVFPFDLRILRILRLFRLLRIFKLSRFSKSFKTI